MGIGDRLRALERLRDKTLITIPQVSGPARRFPLEDAAEAFLCLCEGRDHPLLAAARSSSDPSWSEGAYSTAPATMRDVPDLSE